MGRPSDLHDPERFYHCDCLDEGDEEHDDRFYHCDCLQGGYTPPDSAPCMSNASRE